MKTICSSVLISFACFLGTGASAAVNQQIVNGKIVGATGIQVGADFFNVSFGIDSCNRLIVGCGGAPFVIRSFNVVAAATALSEQVFTGSFDTNHGDTFGCDATKRYCQILTPYAINTRNTSFFNYVGFGNAALESDDFLTNTSPSTRRDEFASSKGNSSFSVVLAVWTPSVANPNPSPIPEPETCALMLGGLALIGAMTRRRNQQASAA